MNEKQRIAGVTYKLTGELQPGMQVRQRSTGKLFVFRRFVTGVEDWPRDMMFCEDGAGNTHRFWADEMEPWVPL